MRAAKFRGFSARIPYYLRGGVPVRRPLLGEKTHAQTRGVDQPDSAFPGEGGENSIHICIDKVVAAIGKDAVDRHSFGKAPKKLGRIPRDADVAHLSLLLQFPQGR